MYLEEDDIYKTKLILLAFNNINVGWKFEKNDLRFTRVVVMYICQPLVILQCYKIFNFRSNDL